MSDPDPKLLIRIRQHYYEYCAGPLRTPLAIRHMSCIRFRSKIGTGSAARQEFEV